MGVPWPSFCGKLERRRRGSWENSWLLLTSRERHTHTNSQESESVILLCSVSLSVSLSLALSLCLSPTSPSQREGVEGEKEEMVKKRG